MKLSSLHRILIIIFSFFCFSYGWGQTAITPIRTDVSGFSSWTDVSISGTTYLQMYTPATASKTVSPTMDFTPYSTITLDFKARTFGGVNTAQNTITVSISTDGSTWATLGTRIPTSSTLTSMTQFSLSGYNSYSTVRIRFETLGSNGSVGAGIDDITINGTVPVAAPVINSSLTKSGTVGTALTYTITATNTPTSYNATSLPAGLSVNTTTGVISGTPTTAGTYSVTITATNASGTDTQTLVITITNPPAPVISSSLTASGTISTAFTYTITATNIPTSYNATSLPAGLSVNTSTGVISGTPTTIGTYSVTITATNAGGTGSATLVITISNPPVPVISSSLTASGTISTAFTYTITATNIPTSYNATSLPAGLSINTSTGVISGTPTTVGTYSVTITATNAGGTGTATLVITITNPPAPVISSSLTASGTVGSAFTYTITATNTPTSYNATSLPAGLSINTSTGVISGTPTTIGTYSVTISATNAGGTGTATLVITIANLPVPVISSSLTANGTVGSAFTYTITATNTPTSYSATSLPAGLSINTSTGVISGTPTTTGVTSVTITATNAGGTGSATLVITITSFTPASGDFRSTMDYADMSWNNTTGTTSYWEYYNGSSWVTTPGDKAPQNATTTPSRVIIKNIGVTGGGNTTKTYNDIVIVSGGELILQANDPPPVAAEFLNASKTLEVQSGGILRVEGDIDLPSTANLIVRSGGYMYIDQASVNNIHPMWDGVENFENNSTLEINNWDFTASATNASLINISGTISNNSGGWKFGNLIFNVATSTSNWTVFGGNASGAGLIVNLTQNNFTISNTSTTNYILGATNKTGTNGFVVNGNMIINSGNFSFGTSFSTDAFSHQFTVNGNFEFNSSGTLKVHYASSIPSSLSGYVNFKGNVKVASTATFNTDKASDNSRMYININGTTATQLIDVGCAATGSNWFVKNGAVAQLSNNNLTFNSLSSLTSTLTVEDGATLHFGWASNGTTPLYYSQASSLTGTVAFASNSGSILKITSADGVVKNTANLGNVQIAVAQKTFNQDATFWYVGKANQNVGDAVGSTGIRNLTVETNPSSLVVTMNANDIKVNSFLTLTSGVLATSNYLLSTISTTASNLIHTVGNASFVYGNLRRYIASNTSTYEFPLGDGALTTNYKRLDLINNLLTPTTYITGSVSIIAQGTPAADVDANLSSSAMLGSTQLTYLLNTAIWKLTPDAQPTGSSYGVNLYVENVSNLSSGDDDNFCPVKRDDASVTYADWSSWLSTPTTIPSATSAGRIYNSGAGYAQRTGYQEFSLHAIAKGPTVPLPIELISFTATCNSNNTVDLKWITASEINNDYFTVEHSSDAVNFEKVLTRNGAGNSHTTITYTDVDNEPLQGVSYYRLKQTDYNGDYKYSNIVSLNRNECGGENNELAIINTTASAEQGSLEVIVNTGYSNILNVELFDMLGKKVYSSSEKTVEKIEKVIIPISNISGGIYLLKISNQSKLIAKKLKL